jgi:hypothetical protein
MKSKNYLLGRNYESTLFPCMPFAWPMFLPRNCYMNNELARESIRQTSVELYSWNLIPSRASWQFGWCYNEVHNKIFQEAFVEGGYYREFCSIERNSSWGPSLTLYFCSSHWKISPSCLKSRWKELTGNLLRWLEMVSKSKSVPRRTGLELSRCMGFQWTHNLGKIPWSSFNPREGSLKVLVEISWIEWTED